MKLPKKILKKFKKLEYRLLHSNLSFPLLKRLTGIGDPIAKKVFREEVIKRFVSGYEPVKQFLLEEGYLDLFSEEELESLGGKDLRNQVYNDFEDDWEEGE